MGTTSSIDLVALDIAGTTVDEGGAVYVALADAVRAAGADPAPADIERWMGAAKHEAIAALLSGSDRTRADPDSVAQVQHDFLRRLDAAYRATPPVPIPGVPEALAELREQGILVALTTGFDQETTDTVLDAVGWRSGVVDTVVCASDVARGRPAPYMIFAAMQRLDVLAVRAVLTAGDTARDVQAGRNGGAGLVVGVLSGSGNADSLAAADLIVASVAELPRRFAWAATAGA